LVIVGRALSSGLTTESADQLQSDVGERQSGGRSIAHLLKSWNYSLLTPLFPVKAMIEAIGGVKE
jgi:lipoate-protein ligase A